MNGVLDMAFLSIIRRWHKRDHVPIREISRRTGVSRNTIRKYLRSDVIEPKFRVSDRPSKLDPYAEKLSAWLRREAGRPRKQRRTAKQLHGDLVSLGYDGSYNRVAAFARAWKEECQRLQQTAGRGSFVPLAFAPGEAFQFDWREDFAVIHGVRMCALTRCTVLPGESPGRQTLAPAGSTRSGSGGDEWPEALREKTPLGGQRTVQAAT